MAYSFTAASSHYISTTADITSLVEGLSTATLSAWVNRSAGSRQAAGFESTASGSDRFGMLVEPDNRVYSTGGDSTTYGQGDLSPTSGVMHIAVVYDGGETGNTNRLKRYQNATSMANPGYGGIVPATLGSTMRPFVIGVDSVPNYSTGDICEVAIWDVVLNTAELVSLSKGFKAHRIRPQNLIYYMPMIRNLTEIIGAAGHTNNNSTPVSAHPRII